MLRWLVSCIEKDIQDEDVQRGKHFVSILLRISEDRNLVLHFATTKT
jgi:hypothetical protein